MLQSMPDYDVTRHSGMNESFHPEPYEILCNSPQYVQRKEQFQSFAYSALIPIVCIPGAIGAVICIIIFSQRQMRSSIYIYLAGLSIFDLVLLITSLMIYPLMNACIERGNVGTVCHMFWQSSLVAFPLSLMAQTCSVWTCVAITVDRFLAIRYPLQTRIWCTPKKAVMALLFITFAGVVYKLPSLFEITLDACGRVQPTPLRTNPLYLMIQTYGYVLLLFVIPWLIIIVLNIITVNTVRTACKERGKMTTNQRVEDNDRRCTKMAFVIIISFISFNLLAAVNQIAEGFNLTLPGHTSRITIGNLLVCVNSASNILVYSIFGRKFRKVFMQLVLSCTMGYQPLARQCDNKTNATLLNMSTMSGIH